MQSSIVTRLDELAGWRSDVDRGVSQLARFLIDHDLIDEPQTAALAALRERLASDRLVLAFVAEFSRGKSELINAIFFAGAGRRVLPATPGRTTMCPVELFHDTSAPSRLSLLPIETRLRGLSLADLRKRDDPWQHVPLEIDNPEALAKALQAVTRTQRVSVETATALGFWSDEQPDDNPPQAADGTVEVPAWRHALINYPHPLLRRGLVVIDTPGLNAIGAEPELTLGLLPTAHATVFVLAADTGVTKSDLAIWREHLGTDALERYVVLNKIDALYDPLASADEVQAQILSQRQKVAETLNLSTDRVFALSARDGLAARVSGSAGSLERSNLGELEDALSRDLLPRQRELLENGVVGVIGRVRQVATRRIGEKRRHQAEQLLELKGLRGKSGGKVKLMLQRVDAEAAEFERCIARLQAVRAVQQRMLKSALGRIASPGAALRGHGHAGGHELAPVQPGRQVGLHHAVQPAEGVAGRHAEAGRRDPRDAGRQLHAAERRLRLCLHQAGRARTAALQPRTGPHRAQLQPLPGPAAELAHGLAGLHGTVPPHAAVQAARGVRKRVQ
jgi:hypothetical protein